VRIRCFSPGGEVVKIAFLNDGPYEYAVGAKSAIGGTERDIWLLSRALAAAGWSVQVGVHGELRVKERKVIDGVEYVGIGHGPILKGQILVEWYRFLSSERPDWLFWEGAYHLWGPLVEIAKLVGVRTIFHACLDADVQPRRGHFTGSRWWPLYAWGLWRADKIFVQHTGQLLLLHPRLRSKVACTLPKVCSLQSNVKPHSERQEYVAWVATLRQHKRPDVLIDIAKSAPDIKFIVCGGPTDYQTPVGYGMRMVEALTKLPNVDYRGRVAPDEAMEVIANAALLLCTSDEEGFPNTFTQAWASGTPVVTLKVDPDSIIEKVGLGEVSRNVDVAIADIHTLMASPDRREEIALRARQHVSENYNQTAVVEIFINAICNGRLGSKQRDDRFAPTD
jgi:glycosyltransferase involved in cell wall biosynthesis